MSIVSFYGPTIIGVDINGDGKADLKVKVDPFTRREIIEECIRPSKVKIDKGMKE